MIPLLLGPPQATPARAVGLGPRLLNPLRGLKAADWPIVVHDPDGAKALASLPGLHISTTQPGVNLLRQSSMVLIGANAPQSWRDDALAGLSGTGIPFWDEMDEGRSSLRFPAWLPGKNLSMAVWSDGDLGRWPEQLASDFLRAMEGTYLGFFGLVGELKSTVFDSMDDEEFRGKVVSQLTRPEVLTLLLQGEIERARTTVLKIVGATTRAL